MVKRSFWLREIENAWEKRHIIWLSGVRRVGKTSLCQSLPEIEYFDCELPRVRRMMEDPEDFLDSLKDKRVVLDEIHRLNNPTEILKIAADHYPKLRVIATGSSTLSASAKFKDSLTGRKHSVWLTPMNSFDLIDFRGDLKHRLLHGGLPPFFMSKVIPESDFQEWVDSYWAKDIQELFRLERRYSFQKFNELLMAQSGGIFEATRFATSCEVSRSTINNYLTVLESTFVVNILRPFSSHKRTEIVAAPKVYAFDTGFICNYRGWHELRLEDLGVLWEHYILNELHSRLQTRQIYYWRDKRHHEIDFILLKTKQLPIAIECKWKANSFDPTHLKAFRTHYIQGENYVVSSDVTTPYRRHYGKILVHFVSLNGLLKKITL